MTKLEKQTLDRGAEILNKMAVLDAELKALGGKAELARIMRENGLDAHIYTDRHGTRNTLKYSKEVTKTRKDIKAIEADYAKRGESVPMETYTQSESVRR